MPHPFRIILVPLVAALAALLARLAPAQDTVDYFKQNCASCHTIGGGRLAGPDLKDVEERQDRAWLVRFMVDPQAMIDSGDAYARDLVQAARGAIMPRAAGIDRARAEKLLDLIAAESKLPRSQFAGVSLSDRPLTAADVERGRDLFIGHERFLNGGPPCASCHTITGLDGLGGGLLGPDLTDAYARLDGRKALGAWLLSPATETMAPIYKTHPLDQDGEVLPLLAYFEDATKKGVESAPGPGIGFLVLGVLGATVALVACDVIWRRRFTGARSKLLRDNR